MFRLRFSHGLALSVGVAGCATPQVPVASHGSYTLAAGGKAPATLAAQDIVLRVWGNGVGRAADGRILSYTCEANQDAKGKVTGTYIMSDAVKEESYFGSFTGGTIVRYPGGGGKADLTCLTTHLGPAGVVLEDKNSASQADTYTYDEPAHDPYAGTVLYGDVRVYQAVRPLPDVLFQPPGYLFDSEAGLYVLAPDVSNHVLGPQQPVPVRGFQLTKPEPIISFDRHRPGGQEEPAGSDDNRPGAFPGVPVFVKDLTAPTVGTNNKLPAKKSGGKG